VPPSSTIAKTSSKHKTNGKAGVKSVSSPDVKNERLWHRRADILIALGTSYPTFFNRVEPFLPEDSKRDGLFYLPDVISAALSSGIFKSKARAVSEDEDEDFSGGTSSHLERLRKVKADDAEVEFAKKCGDLVSVSDWESRVAVGLWGTLERYGGLFKQQFGNGGTILFNRMVDSIKRKLTGQNDE